MRSIVRSPLAAAFLLGATLLAGCGDSGPPTAGTATTFAAICDKANDGKRLALEGYLTLPEDFTKSSSVVLRLRQAQKLGGDVVGVTANFGDAPNTVKAITGKSYSDTDLGVHTTDGATLTYQDRVRVSGTLYFPTMSNTVEFHCALSNPLFERVSGS